MKNIVIIGVGGFGREVKILIDQINQVDKEFNLLGFYDDANDLSSNYNGLPYLGTIEDLNSLGDETAVVLGVGDPNTKQKIISKLTNSNLTFPSLIHPSVILGNDNVTIGEGSIICAGCIITCNIEIGRFVTLNLMCTVGHDTKIGSYSSFMPSVNISGEVLIDEFVYVGTGAKIINQLSIGQDTIIGAGAVVSKSLPSNCTAVGIPAKPIKFHN
jgi:sugar O-acyltransferase (sialic acid O-acetyltransferase NeuD family)